MAGYFIKKTLFVLPACWLALTGVLTADQLEEMEYAFCGKDEWGPTEAENAHAQGKFLPYVHQETIPSHDRDVWIRGQIHNPEAEPAKCLIAFEGFWDDRIEVHFREASGQWATLKTGEIFSRAERDVPRREPAVMINLEPGEKRTLFLHMQSLVDVQPGHRIWPSARDFFASRTASDLGLGLYLGLFSGLFLYNGFLNIVLRRKEFTYYLAYLLSVAFNYALIQNIYLEFGWVIGSPAVTYLLSISLGAIGYFMLRFSLDFLNVPEAPDWFARIIRPLLWVNLACCALGTLFLLLNTLQPEWQVSLVLANDALVDFCLVLPMLQTAFLAIGGFKAAKKGSREAFIFGLAFSVLLAGYIPMAFAQLGFIYRSESLLHFIQLGSSAEMLLLAFALAEKMSGIRREKEAADLRAIEEQKRRFLLEEINTAISRQKDEIEAQSEELRKLNEEKNAMLGMAAHDLRNPLYAIQSVLDLLDEDEKASTGNKLPREVRDDLYTSIGESTRHTLSLVNDLLDTASVEKQLDELELSQIDLSAVVKQALRFNEGKAREKEIHIKSDITEPVHAACNSRALLEICDNLISNAIKFSPKGSRVSLSLKGGDNPFIRIEDDGPGFTEEDRGKIFQRFARLSAKPTGGEASNGLGLAIVHSLVNGLGLDLHLHSEPGKGATFTITGFDRARAPRSD